MAAIFPSDAALWFQSGQVFGLELILSAVSLDAANVYSQNQNQWPVKYFLQMLEVKPTLSGSKIKTKYWTKHEEFRIPVHPSKERERTTEWKTERKQRSKNGKRFSKEHTGRNHTGRQCSGTLCSHVIQWDIRLVFLTEGVRSCLHLSPSDFDLRKHSQICPHADKHTLASTQPKHTLAPMAVITEHLLSIPTQSEVMWKAFSELTSCTLQAPSSFFCWLQLSVAVWARCCLIALPLPNLSYLWS